MTTLLRFLTVCGILLLAASHAQAAIINVGPTLPLDTLAKVDWSKVKPGDQVVLNDGAYESGPVMISAQGTASAPITIMPAAGAHPVVKSSIFFENAAFITAKGLTVTGTSFSGFVIRHQSHDITIAENIIYNTPLGIWIGDEAGGKNVISRNRIYNNKTHGVAVDFIVNEQGSETLIQGNEIYQNGDHGIELSGSNFIIDHNLVHENGLSIPGTSNIHIFAGPVDGSKHEGIGLHNRITFNVVYGEHDAKELDGNGIEADAWCNENEISHNVAFDNDGAGIALYMAANNNVISNTVYGNVKDSGHTHLLKGEIVIASNADIPAMQSENNKVAHNIVAASRSEIFAVFAYQADKDLMTSVENNVLFNTATPSNLVYVQNPEKELPSSLGSNQSVDPGFVNASQPLQGGLRQKMPAKGMNLGAYAAGGSGVMP